MKRSATIAVIGVLIFIGFGSIVFASATNSCALGPAGTPEEELNDTNKRSDDYSWFTHFVCTSAKARHNR